MPKIRVTVSYTKEFEFDGNSAEFVASVKNEEQREKIISYVMASNTPDVNCSDEEERERMKMWQRIEEVTSNIGKDGFPDEPVQFLRKHPDDYWDIDSAEHPGKRIVLWEPFEQYPPDKIADYIEGKGLWE